MNKLVTLCSFEYYTNILREIYNYDNDSFMNKVDDLYKTFDKSLENCTNFFDPWCYIANNIELKHEFWDYNNDTLNIFDTCLNYILNNRYNYAFNLSITEAKYKLKYMCSIAIVGNAPISLSQQNEINEYDIVIRNNNCNSFRNGDKLDILFYRAVRLKAATDFPFNIVKQCHGAKLYHINGKLCDETHFYNNLCKKLYHYESTSNDIEMYEKLKEKHIPSCGFICIKKMQKLFEDVIIDIYGFNFQVLDRSYHNLKFEKDTILQDKKLIYHETNTNIKSIHHKAT